MGKSAGPLWPRFLPLVPVQTVSDIGELAARMGSLVTYSRSGTVVFVDGFEDGLSPYVYSDEAGVAVTSLETSISYRGTNSAKMQVASDGADYCLLLKYIPLYRVGKMGLEVHFKHVTNKEVIWIGFSMLEDNIQYESYILIDIDDKSLWVNDDVLGTTKFADLDLTMGEPDWWHAAKLVVDMDNHQYVKFFIDDNEYDLSDYSPFEWPDARQDHLQTAVFIHRTGANAVTLYVDDYIITIDEN